MSEVRARRDWWGVAWGQEPWRALGVTEGYVLPWGLCGDGAAGLCEDALEGWGRGAGLRVPMSWTGAGCVEAPFLP